MEEIKKIMKKLVQALRIRAEFVKRNSQALSLISSRKTRERGIQLLQSNIDREEKFIEIAKRGSKEGISQIEEAMKLMEKGHFTHKSLNMAEEMKNFFEFFEKKFLKAVRKRIYFERKLLHANAIGKKYYLMRMKRAWEDELILDSKSYEFLNLTDLSVKLSIWQKIRGMAKEAPKGFLWDQAKKAFWSNNFAAAIVANPAAGAFIALSPNMDSAQKTAAASLIWTVTGILARLTQMMMQVKEIYEVSTVHLNVERISKLSVNEFIMQHA